MKDKIEANMGQKVNPHGLRVGVIKDWDSKWYAKLISLITLLKIINQNIP